MVGGGLQGVGVTAPAGEEGATPARVAAEPARPEQPVGRHDVRDARRRRRARRRQLQRQGAGAPRAGARRRGQLDPRLGEARLPRGARRQLWRRSLQARRGSRQPRVVRAARARARTAPPAAPAPEVSREGGPPRRRSPRRAWARGERATPLRRGGKEATPGAGRTEESWRLARAAAPRPQPATRRPPRWAKPRSGETSARAFPQPLCAPRAWWEGLSLERVWWRG